MTTALGPNEPPWWAGLFPEIEHLVTADDWEGICRALGLGHLERDHWLVVWEYEVRLLDRIMPRPTLFKPTVVEACDNPFHFPSPAQAPLGTTMALREELDALCHEVLHPPLQGELAAEACAFPLQRVAGLRPIDHNEALELRLRHRRALAGQQRAEDHAKVAAWLDRHPEEP